MNYTRKIFNLKCDWDNHIITVMLKINPLFDKIESNNKLYYLRMSFKQYYPSIYERLTYAVVKDEEMNIIKQIIELSLREKETNTLNTKKNLGEIRSNNQPYDAQPLYKKKVSSLWFN